MSSFTQGLNPFQLRHVRLLGGMLAASVAITSGVPALSGRGEFSATAQFILGVLAVGPIMGTMVVLARYLRGETDEYVRNLVVRSILWGFGLVMVATPSSARSSSSIRTTRRSACSIWISSLSPR